MPIKLIVGLGNPGDEYQATRHNIGFRLLDYLAGSDRFGGWKAWKSSGRKLAEYGQCGIGSDACFLLRPLTFMNESGLAVKDFAEKNHIGPSEMLVCFDDFALPFLAANGAPAKLRLRARGSSGGHNGMQSIVDQMGTKDIPRLRIGVGPLTPGRDPADFVLSRFGKKEQEALPEALERASNAVCDAVSSGIEFAMNRYNASEAPETGKE